MGENKARTRTLSLSALNCWRSGSMEFFNEVRSLCRVVSGCPGLAQPAPIATSRVPIQYFGFIILRPIHLTLYHSSTRFTFAVLDYVDDLEDLRKVGREYGTGIKCIAWA